MQWIEVTVTLSPDLADLAAGVLEDFGHQGVSIERDDIQPDHWDEGELPPPDASIVRAYMVADARAETARLEIDTALAAYNLPPAAYQRVDDEDWAEAWKAHYHTTRIGNRIVIRPVWEEYAPEPGDLVIALDPGMAFGTGTHATTRLCLMSMEELMRPGLSVLDLGCGSGILAIAAVMLGAAHVTAIDIDPVAADITRDNAEANLVADRITAMQGSLETVRTSARRFDLLLANILARIIIEMCDQGLGDIVRPGGAAIFSGIITEQVTDVATALERAGYRVTHVRTEGDWVSIEALRSVEP
ncbi:MAG: 50S ribosomal protein L11 methyltransferase [Chloroflexi bacterium]|nr:50S ribosomal protein L11 methyltransferase [Chloroflexota bacterium]